MKLALVLVAFTACANVEQSQVEQSIGCTSWGCGMNSATVGDGLLFDEIDSSGVQANHGNLRLVAVTAPDGVTPWKIRVKRQELIATTLDGSMQYRGYALVNAVLVLKDVTSGQKYEIEIAGYYPKSITFWEGAPEVVPFYDFRARTSDPQVKQYVCKYDVLTTDPRWTGVEHAAIVFQWDRYDPVLKTVTETAVDDPWFQIACATTAPAKLHLMRHTRAGSYNESGTIAYNTTVKQRQAALKMLTADYCGGGHSFTTDGVPLVYNANQPWWVSDTRSGANEALWDASGAICLDTPRYESPSTILSTCGYLPPSCGALFTDWWNHAYLMTKVPPPT